MHKRTFSNVSYGGANEKGREQQLNAAVQLVQNADLVAIDLEFSGLFQRGNFSANKTANLHDYYSYCREAVKEFLIVQLGVCTAVKNKSTEERNHWVLTPFSFHVYPSKKTIFKSDSSSLFWLVEQGFDPVKWIVEGYDYEQLAVITSNHAPKNANVERLGVQRVIEALIENPKPLIVHNGLLDLLHIYQKFIGELPETLEEFQAKFHLLFPAGVYDTKRIAENGRITVFSISDAGRGATTLDALRFHLMRDQFENRTLFVTLTLGSRESGYSLEEVSRKKCKKGSPPNREPISLATSDENISKRENMDTAVEEGSEGAEGSEEVRKMHASHEAGYDAMMTLHVFLLEVDWVSRAVGEKTTPGNWEQLALIKNSVDKVEVLGVAPGYLELNGGELEEKKTAPVDCGV